MGGDYERAIKSLEKVTGIMGKEDLHDVLLMTECSVLMSGENTRGFLKKLRIKIFESNLPNKRIKLWSSRFFPRPGHNVDSLRSIGGVLLLCGVTRKLERQGMLVEDYVKELRDLLVGIDSVSYYVIRRNYSRRLLLSKFFAAVRTDLLAKLVDYNGKNTVDQACVDHGIITDYCVQEDYRHALQKADSTIREMQGTMAWPSEYKIFARLLMWRGILRVIQGDVELGIVDLECAKTSMKDPTDYCDDRDREYLMSTVESNLRHARKGKANLKSLQGDMYHAASSPMRPKVSSAAVTSNAASGAPPSAGAEHKVAAKAKSPPRPQPASGAVKHQTVSVAGKWIPVKEKVSAKAKSPRSKSKSRKSK